MADAITLMQAMLARVRPVGMSDDAAREWLAVAASDVRHLPMHVLHEACEEAKRKVQFHTGIVAAVLGSNAVQAHERHEREIRRLQRDGHVFPDRPALALEGRGGAKKIGSVVKIEDYRE